LILGGFHPFERQVYWGEAEHEKRITSTGKRTRGQETRAGERGRKKSRAKKSWKSSQKSGHFRVDISTAHITEEGKDCGGRKSVKPPDAKGGGHFPIGWITRQGKKRGCAQRGRIKRATILGERALLKS